jgi:hypothetical protein
LNKVSACGGVAQGWLPISVAIAMLFLTGCSREISGTYLAKFSNGIWSVQLVRTPDNRLTGQLETSVLEKSGKIVENTVPLTGAVNGDNVSISSTFWGFQIVTLSGKVDWNKLTLTGPPQGLVVLERSDLSDYKKQSSVLIADSQRITNARAAAATRARTERAAAARQKIEQSNQNLVSAIDGAIQRVNKFESDVDVHLARFPGVETRYRAISAKIVDYADRARQLPDAPNSSATRGQLSVAANQAAISADQLHNSVLSLRSALRNHDSSLGSQLIRLKRACQNDISRVAFTDVSD